MALYVRYAHYRVCKQTRGGFSGEGVAENTVVELVETTVFAARGRLSPPCVKTYGLFGLLERGRDGVT